jgi:hypothetical protein
MPSAGRSLTSFVLFAAAVLSTRCDAKDPPSSPSPAVTQVQVGVSGNAPAQLVPGESRQLFAQGTQSNGTVIDVTNLATWQSSNPAVATVSGSGQVSAASEGAIDVTATYQTVRGTLRIDVRRLSCDLGLAPPAASFTAFGGSATVQVSVAPADCRWTARGASSWFQFESAERTGSGAFTYTVPPNSTPNSRSMKIAVIAATGQQVEHEISQARPAGCSYVTAPDTATFTAAGGSGAFDVITTPNDCQWRASTTLGSFGVSITGGFSGTGAGRVRYTVQSHARTVDVDGFIEIAGLSGLNPPGRHHVVIQKR